MKPRVLIAAFLTAGVLGCGSSGSPSPSTPQPVVAGARDGQFELAITAGQAQYRANQPIQVMTRLTYLGPRPDIKVGHAGAGPAVVTLEQLDGPFDPGGGSDTSCGSSVLKAGVPVDAAYQKSGGWSGEDPMADEYRTFFADPLVRLPAGTYRFTATADIYEGDCGSGPLHSITASITLVVAP